MPATTPSAVFRRGELLSDPFLPVAAELENLKDNAPPGAAIISALKTAWRTARSAAAEVNRLHGGRDAGEMLSGYADRMLEMLLKFALQRAGLEHDTGVAILALGSYGRRELAPYSDIDMMLLHHDAMKEEQLDALVGNILHPMWDCGLQVGHSVRRPQDCTRRMDDIDDATQETATSLLESRFVSGDRAFSDSFLKIDMPLFFERSGRKFVEAKFQEALTRWQGQSVSRTQPNIKDSPGALRDFQLAVWIDKARAVLDV